MKIISQFKDYYDYVAHQYGGGDPKIVYHRKRFTEPDNFGSYPDLVFDKLKTVPDRFPNYQSDYIYRWLAICGKIYLIFRKAFDFKNREFRLVSENADPDLWKYLIKKSNYSFLTQKRTDWLGFESQRALELSKQLRAPIFTFNSSNSISYIQSEIPILAKYGFASFLSPEQLYQDIAYFMGNTINESPDLMPSSVMSDKERILQHGFDLQQSFRHRK